MKQVIVGITGNIKEMPAMSGMYFDAVSRHLSDGVKVAGGVPESVIDRVSRDKLIIRQITE